MIPIDFEYDGIRMSAFDLVFGNVGNSFADDQPFFTPLKVNSFRQTSMNKNRLTRLTYDDVLETEFTMIKNPCVVTDNAFTDLEIRQIEKWLNKKQYKMFKPIYDDSSFFDMVLYAVTTQIKEQRIGPNIIGLTVSMTTNAPYGFSHIIKGDYILDSTNTSFTIHPISDELTLLYPSMFMITVINAGNIIISNSMDPYNDLEIDNCVAGEIITLDCENQLISSDQPHPDLPKEFNYNYPRLKPDENNVFTSSDDCSIHIEYQSIRKGGVIL